MLWIAIQVIKKSPTLFLRKATRRILMTVHSVIEKESRHQTIYTTEQLFTVVRGARKSKQPYIVTELTSDDILDFMAMSNKVKNFKVDENKQNVKWMNIRSKTSMYFNQKGRSKLDLLQDWSQQSICKVRYLLKTEKHWCNNQRNVADYREESNRYHLCKEKRSLGALQI